MRFSQRRRRWILLAIVAATLGVLLWGSYVFSVIWLRRSYARELMAAAPPISNRVVPNDTPGINQIVPMLYEPRAMDFIAQLEALQHPTIPVVARSLFARMHRQETEATLSQWIASFPLTTAIRFTTTQAAVEQSETAIDAVGTGMTVNMFLLASIDDVWIQRVTDAAGDSVLLVSRGIARESVADRTAESATHETLLIDADGVILDRTESHDRVLGRLPEPLGKADQLIFSAGFGYVHSSNGVFRPVPHAPVRILVVENGKLKVVRTASIQPGDESADTSGALSEVQP